MTEKVYVVETTSDGLHDNRPEKQQLWAVACSAARAVDLVLSAVPEGWTAKLREKPLTPEQAGQLQLRTGNIRQL